MHSHHLGFLHWSKESVGLDEQQFITKSFVISPTRGGGGGEGPLVITYFCVDKLSESQISVVGER